MPCLAAASPSRATSCSRSRGGSPSALGSSLVGRGGAGPHDLGYLRSRRLPGRTHERTHYELTPKGLDALRAWVATPPDHPRVVADGILRLLAADLVGDQPVKASLLTMRGDLA